MKKLLAILLTMIFVCSLCACGSGDSSDTKTTESTQGVVDEQTSDDGSAVEKKLEDVTAYVEKVLSKDVSKYDKKVDTNNENITFTHKEYDNSNIELDLTFDGIKIKNGTMAKDFIDAGYEMSEGDKEIEAGYEMSTFYMVNSQNTQFGLSLYNDTDATKQAKECAINGFSCDSRGVDYVDYRGLTKSSDLEDVIGELGLPKLVYISQIADNDPHITLTYTSEFDAETNDMITLIISLSFANNGTDIYEFKFL